jgi:hypothetical protein
MCADVQRMNFAVEYFQFQFAHLIAHGIEQRRLIIAPGCVV